jgi:hypothetical protein
MTGLKFVGPEKWPQSGSVSIQADLSDTKGTKGRQHTVKLNARDAIAVCLKHSLNTGTVGVGLVARLVV